MSSSRRQASFTSTSDRTSFSKWVDSPFRYLSEIFHVRVIMSAEQRLDKSRWMNSHCWNDSFQTAAPSPWDHLSVSCLSQLCLFEILTHWAESKPCFLYPPCLPSGFVTYFLHRNIFRAEILHWFGLPHVDASLPPIPSSIQSFHTLPPPSFHSSFHSHTSSTAILLLSFLVLHFTTPSWRRGWRELRPPVGSGRKGRDHHVTDGGRQRRYKLESSSIVSFRLPYSPHSPRSLHPPPPLLMPGWYDLLDYKTALPCVCLLSVPARRKSDTKLLVRLAEKGRGWVWDGGGIKKKREME